MVAHHKRAYDRPRIIELHEKGIPRCAIAARVGCSVDIVGKVIAQHKGGGGVMAAHHKMTSDEKERIVSMHENGASRAAIAARVGLNVATVGYVIRAHKRALAAKAAKATQA